MKKYNFSEILNISDIITMADFVAIYNDNDGKYYIYKNRTREYNKGDIITKEQFIQRMQTVRFPLVFHNEYIKLNEITETLPWYNKEYRDLELILQAVMYSVDKWFDEIDESKDEVNRAADAREIALRAIESRDALISEIIDKVEIIREKHLDLTHHNNYPRTMDVCNEITNLIDKFYSPDKGD